MSRAGATGRSEYENLILTYVELLKSYEMLIEHRKKLYIADDHLSMALCTIYAIWCACQIRERLDSTWDTEVAPKEEESSNDGGKDCTLPKYETVHRAAQELLIAIASGNSTAISDALKEMAVLSFCPKPGQVFSCMEDITSRVIGPAQQVFLVDLSLFAAEVGDYQRAGRYVQQAHAFDPTSRELYSICVVEGLIALKNGRVNEAVQHLDNSAKACQADVDSSIQCALLPPSLGLATKLFELGEHMPVLRYLLDCHNVWQSRRPQIEEWIHIIESGEKPAFQISDILGDADQASYRLRVQWMRACSLEMRLSPAKPRTPMSPTQVLAERERRMTAHKVLMNAYVQKELEYIEKELSAPPKNSSSNTADRGPTE